MHKAIHIEGIPGSGKSTAAERLTAILYDKGIDAAWWREESADHPIMPRQRRALSRYANFPALCLNAWRSFLESPPNQVAVLDGYALQTTVRFLFEQQFSQANISRYFQHWQELAPTTTIVYLQVNNPVAHYNIVLPERGNDWAQKLFSWVECTPLGKAQRLKGKPGFIEFWSSYQALCLDLLDSATIEVELVEARSWSDATLEAMASRRGWLP